MINNESNNDQEVTSDSPERTSNSSEKTSESSQWDSERMNILAGFEDKNPVSTTTTENSAVESEESLLTESDPYSLQTEQSFQNHPLSKLVLVSLTVLAIVATTGAILSSNLMGTSKPQRQLQQPALTPKQEAQSDLETDNQGRVMTELALTSQRKELEALNEKFPQQPKPAEQHDIPSAKPTTTNPTRAPARTYSPHRPVAAYSPPRSSTYTSIPKPVEQPKPITRPIAEVPATAAATDPMKAWLAAAQLGSYGQLPSVEPPEAVAAKAPNELQSSVMSPSNTIVTSSSPGIEYAAFDKASNESKHVFPQTSVAKEQQAPTNFESEEAPILQEQPRQSISAGTKAKAILASPLIVDESQDNSSRFTIILAEPLLAADGSVALPAKSQLVTKIGSLSESGLVRLVAVALVVEQRGEQIEIPISEEAIEISSVQNTPLIAQQLFDKKRKNGGLNIGRLALNTIKEAANIHDSYIVESGASTLLEQIEERNSRSIEALRERPLARFLPAGTFVNVFANRSFWIPINNQPE